MELTSKAIGDGAAIEVRYAEPGLGGANISPDVSWTPGPDGTQSYAITCFDPDAPVPAGWWHWAVLDLPASASRLEEGAAFHLRGDTGDASYFGAAPPPGDRPHRYVFSVHALDVDTLGLDDDATPTMAAFTALGHTLARADLTVTFQA